MGAWRGAPVPCRAAPSRFTRRAARGGISLFARVFGIPSALGWLKDLPSSLTSEGLVADGWQHEGKTPIELQIEGHIIFCTVVECSAPRLLADHLNCPYYLRLPSPVPAVRTGRLILIHSDVRWPE